MPAFNPTPEPSPAPEVANSLESDLEIDRWNRQNPDLNRLHSHFNELIVYSETLKPLMERSNVLRQSVKQDDCERMIPYIDDSRAAWTEIEKFFDTTFPKIVERYKMNQEYFDETPSDKHRAWALALPDFRKEIATAYSHLATVTAGLMAMGYPPAEFEAPGDRARYNRFMERASQYHGVPIALWRRDFDI